MFVVSIGSCFAKRVARQINGANLISSVYHNRSDVLLDILRSKGRSLKPRSKICKLMGIPLEGDDEFSPFSVISNQSAEGFGLHDLPHGIRLMRALMWMKLDLILIDNFMDHSAKLYRTPIGPYFCRYGDFAPPEEFPVRGKLSAEQSAANFEQVVALIRRMQPSAHIAFLQFAANNYTDRKRLEWSWAFRDAFTLPKDVLNIHPRKVKPRWTDREPQHFHPREYTRYASEIEAWVQDRDAESRPIVRRVRSLQNSLAIKAFQYI